MPEKKHVTIMIALGVLCILMVGASLVIGTEQLDLGQAWREWRAGTPLDAAPTLGILVQQRMPRTLAALIVGCGLALAGCAFQALLRNPLAEPYTLGISSAGAFGAWTATILVEAYQWPSSVLGVPMIQFCAFTFAIADMVTVYLLSARRSRVSPSVLLLSGVTLGLLANSGILLMRYLADPQRLVSMDRWLMGGVDVLGYQKEVIPLFVGVTPCVLILLAQASKFDQLGFGAEIAAGRGVNVTRLQFITFGVGSFLTAIIVSKVGPIGFVGLIVPHLVRGVTGSRHRILMPLTALAGGAFLCFCDIIARKILPGETPIGIVTTIIGGPFFLFLLMRRRFTDWQT